MTHRPPGSRMHAAAVASTTMVAVAALVLSGCSGSSDPSAAPSPTATTAAPAPPSPIASPTLPPVPSTGTGAPSAVAATYCEGLLARRDVTALVGRRMAAPSVVPVFGAPGCTWGAADGSGTSVQLVNASASTWATQLPNLQSTLESQDTTFAAKTRDDLATAAQQVAGGQEVDADLACTIFSDLAADTGYGEGKSATLRLQQQGTQSSVVAQGCSSDLYTFLQVTATGLDADAVVPRASQTLQQAHGAPLVIAGPLPS